MKLYLPFIGILLLSVFACEKEAAFKNPTTVVFSFEKEATSVGGPDLLTLDAGYIVLGKFSVLGERTGAENFTFSRTFEDGLHIPLDHTTILSDLEFDLPQGNYDGITVTFETYEDGNPNLFIEGEYQYLNPLKQPSDVHLELFSSKTFEVEITNSVGGKTFTLEETVEETPTIILDPKKWFDGVIDNDMVLANVNIANNQQVILLNQSNNLPIFNQVDNQVGNATVCILD